MATKTPSGQDSQALLEELNLLKDTLRDTSFQLEEKVEELSLLRRIVDIAGHIFDLALFYRNFIDILLEETNAQNCSLMVMDEEKQELILKIARGRNDDGTFFDYPVYSGTTFALGEGIAGKVALQREILVINDVTKDQRFARRETRFAIGSLLCAPLFIKEKILGVINISHGQMQAFSTDKQRVMKILCGFVSSIINNAVIHLRNEEKLKAMFEGVRLAIILFDSATLRIVDCNRYTEYWLGYGKEELTHASDPFRMFMAEDRKQAKQLFNEILAKNSSGFHELTFLKKDGSVTTGEIKGTVIQYRERETIHLTIRDVSERRQMQQKVLQAEKLKSLGEMAGGVAHDFNNVLAAILGRAQLLKSSIACPPGEPEKRKSFYTMRRGLEIIEQAALDGAETVRRIQEFSRRRDDDKYFTQVDLNRVIQDALDFTRVRWKDEAESKDLKVKIQKSFSPVAPIAGSGAELREVFTNLINNALDAMPQGGRISITTFMRDNRVVIILEDSGVGIPPSIKEKIFDPFFTTKGVQSTGLGMSVSYGIINRHKGTISVESTEGRGTTFTISLPASERIESQDEGKTGEAAAKRARILIIDDDEAVRELLCDILTENGYEVASAVDGRQGLELFKEGGVDMVFTDLGMPGMSGWQVAEEIKILDRTKPVALITGWEVQLDRKELERMGVALVINKPFKVDQVLQLVQEGMERQDNIKKI